jgi:glycosyltransferase involved in cell wall biosynthesis
VVARMSRENPEKKDQSFRKRVNKRSAGRTNGRESRARPVDGDELDTAGIPAPREPRTVDRPNIPIIITFYNREQETGRMLDQLERVTDDYSLIIVDNGFDDEELLRELDPLHYVRNKDNKGAIKPINQGLDLAEGEFIAVLHNDLLIFDEGWLDNIVRFMQENESVGLVGLAGRHEIKEDGSLVIDSTVVNMRGYPDVYVPSWKFTEVATIDGLGWVMRNEGFRLEEDFGMMHFYDVDLSLQYIQAGYKVFACAVDNLEKVGGDDGCYYAEVREKFRRKWAHMLPIRRGSRDQSYLTALPDEHRRLIEEFEKKSDGMTELENYTRKLERELALAQDELDKAGKYARDLEANIEQMRSTGGGTLPGAKPPPSIAG